MKMKPSFMLLFLVSFSYLLCVAAVKGFTQSTNVDSIIILGDRSIASENYLQAMEHFMTASGYLENVKEKNSRLAYTYMKTAICYDYFDFTDFSRIYILKAIASYKNINDKQGMAYCHTYFGDMLEDEGNNPLAKKYHELALLHFKQADDRKGMALVYDNLASVYENLGRYDTSLQYFNTALAIYKLSKDSIGMSVVLNNLGDIYLKIKDKKKALEYFHKSLAIAVKIKNKEEERGNLKDLSKAYASMNNYKEAFMHYSRFYEIHQNLKIEKKIEDIARLQVRTLQEKNELEMRTEVSENQVVRLRFTIALVLMALLFVVLLAIYVNYRFRATRNRQIALLQKEKMQAEIDTRMEKLLDYTRMLAERGEIIEDLKNKIDKTFDKEKELKNARFKAIQQLSNASILTDDQWRNFKRQFEEVYEGFFSKLQQLYPEMSTGDIRIAALLKLGLSNDDIAHMMGISPDSVKKAKSRMKKKISDDEEFKLKEWIENV